MQRGPTRADRVINMVAGSLGFVLAVLVLYDAPGCPDRCGARVNVCPSCSLARPSER